MSRVGVPFERLRSLLAELGEVAGEQCTHPECREIFYRHLREQGDQIVDAFPSFARDHARESVAALIDDESRPERVVPCARANNALTDSAPAPVVDGDDEERSGRNGVRRAIDHALAQARSADELHELARILQLHAGAIRGCAHVEKPT